jgi:hypothetical protein
MHVHLIKELTFVYSCAVCSSTWETMVPLVDSNIQMSTLLLDVHTCITRVYVSVYIQMSTLLLDVHIYITLVYVSVYMLAMI